MLTNRLPCEDLIGILMRTYEKGNSVGGETTEAFISLALTSVITHTSS